MTKIIHLVAFLVLASFIHVNSALAENAIGIAAVVKGDVFVQNGPDAEKIPLNAEDKVYEKQIITTGERARAQVIFDDDSIFTIGRNSEIILDEFVYDPETGDGKSLIEATKGVVKFVTGKIAKKDHKQVKVNTPFATIGVRGSGGIIQVQPDGQTVVGLTQCCLDVGPRNAPNMPTVPLDDLSTFTKVSDPTGPASQPVPMTPEMSASLNADLAGGFEAGTDPEGDGEKKVEKKEEAKKLEPKKEEAKREEPKKLEKKEEAPKKAAQKPAEQRPLAQKPIEKKGEQKQAAQQPQKQPLVRKEPVQQPAQNKPQPNAVAPERVAEKAPVTGGQPQPANGSQGAPIAQQQPVQPVAVRTENAPPPVVNNAPPPVVAEPFSGAPTITPFESDTTQAGTQEPIGTITAPIDTTGISAQSNQDQERAEQRDQAVATHTGFFKRYNVGGAVTKQGTTSAYLSNDTTRLITSFKEEGAGEAGNPTELKAGAKGSVFTVPTTLNTKLNDGANFGGRGYQSASGGFFYYEFEDTTDASKGGMVVAAKEKITAENVGDYHSSGVQHYQFFNDSLKGDAGFFDYNQHNLFRADANPQEKAATGLSVDWDKKRFASGQFSWGADAAAGKPQGYDVKVAIGKVNDTNTSTPVLQGQVYEQTKYKDGASWNSQLSEGTVTASAAYGTDSVVEAIFLDTDADTFSKQASALNDIGDINSTNVAVTDLNPQADKLNGGPTANQIEGFTAGFIERGTGAPKVFLNKGANQQVSSGAGSTSSATNGKFVITKDQSAGTVKADIRVASSGPTEQFATKIGGTTDNSALITKQHYAATESQDAGVHQFDGSGASLAALNTANVDAVLASGSMADNNSGGVSELCATCAFTEWGVWAASFKEVETGGVQNDVQSMAHLTPFVAGERTQTSVLDTLAGNNVTATYAGHVFGAIAKGSDYTYHTGDLAANANFNNRKVGIDISNFGGYHFAGDTGNNAYGAVNNFAGSLDEVSGSGTGSFNGAFFGPTAEEVGVNFEFSAQDGATSAGVGQATQ